MIGWNLDTMSDAEILKRHSELCAAQVYKDKFPELISNLRTMQNYMQVRFAGKPQGHSSKLPNIMSAGMKF